MLIIDEGRSFRKLTMAIIERAVFDLSLSHSRYSEVHRQDAYEFLTEGLWKEDCLWGHFLEGTITKSKMITLVKRKLRNRR